jgi:hypothetical protein
LDLTPLCVPCRPCIFHYSCIFLYLPSSGVGCFQLFLYAVLFLNCSLFTYPCRDWAYVLEPLRWYWTCLCCLSKPSAFLLLVFRWKYQRTVLNMGGLNWTSWFVLPSWGL